MKCNIWIGKITGHFYIHNALCEAASTASGNNSTATLNEEQQMYLIQRTDDGAFFAQIIKATPHTPNGMWTSSKGFASWYPSKNAAKQLIDIKSRNGEWDASKMQVVPVRQQA